MFFRLLLSGLLIALLAVAVSAQVQRVASVIHETHTISSKVLNEDRTILVKVPNSYARSEIRYPVVYMLDAHWPLNEMMGGLVEQQSWSGMIPEVIVVGIQNIARQRDLTPTAVEQRRGSGGGRKFLEFIETEVIPHVEKNYRTEPYRIFAGHSLAGLFVIYSMLERPEIFNAFIAASPVIHWDENYLIKRAEKYFSQSGRPTQRLYVGLGNEPEYVPGFNSFQALLKREKPKGLEYRFEQFKDENHGSVVLPAYYAGLRMIFEGWDLQAVDNIADVMAHFRKLSERFGYRVLPSEVLINNVGYALLRAGRNLEAIDAFKRNTELYPSSANVYDSLAEAYERSGQKRHAVDNYEKAFKLAETRGESQLAASAKANLERLRGNNR